MKSRSVSRLMCVLGFLFSATVSAAGGPVDEDYLPLVTLSDAMIDSVNKNDHSRFYKTLDEAMKLAKEMALQNNSMRLTKVTPRFKAAKKALQNGLVSDCVSSLKQGKQLLQDKKPALTWDGGV